MTAPGATTSGTGTNFATETAQRLWDWITSARLTQPFGGSHRGVDLAWGAPGTGTGTPVYAPQEGIVRRAGWDTHGYGNAVYVELPSGVTYILGHLSRINVQVGQGVAAGDLVGNVGSTGTSTGPHLHLEIRDRNGVPIPIQGQSSSGVASFLNSFWWGRSTLGHTGHDTSWDTGTSGGSSTNGSYETDGGAGLGNLGASLSDLFSRSGAFLVRNDAQAASSDAVSKAAGIAVLGVGALLVLMGIFRLGKEGPVQVAVQPVKDTTQGVKQVAETAAKVAAVVAK